MIKLPSVPPAFHRQTEGRPGPAAGVESSTAEDDLRIERLCDLAADRAGLIRGVAPDLRACAGFDPALNRCMIYFRLDGSVRAEDHREVAVAELDRWEFRLLASGSAPTMPEENAAYCLLVDAGWEDVPDLRAAMLKAVIAWNLTHGGEAEGSSAGK